MSTAVDVRAPRRSIAGLLTAQGAMRAADAGALVAVVSAFQAADRSAWLPVGVAAQLSATVVALPAAGALIDRFGGARMLWLNHVCRTLVLVAATAVWAIDGATTKGLIAVCAGAALLGLTDAFAEPAFHATLPRFVAPSQLASVNAASAVQTRLSMIAGAGLTGVGITVSGATGGLIVVAALAAAGAAAGPTWIGTTRRLGIWESAPDADTGAAMRTMVKEGFNYVRTRTWLWTLLLLFSVVTALVVAAQRVALPPLAEPLGAAGYAVYTTIYAVGSAAGALIAIRLDRRWRASPPGVALATAVACAGYAAVGVAGARAGLVAIGISGAAMGVAVVLWAVLMQREVDPSMLGRVSSLDWLATLAPSPVAVLLVGWLVEHGDDDVVVAASGAAAAVGCVLAAMVLSRPASGRAADARS